VAYLLCWPAVRPLSLDAGRVGDRLVLSGVNGDERDRGVTYRWTTTRTALVVPGWEGVTAAHIEVHARNGRVGAGGMPDGSEIAYAADLGGRDAAALAAGPTWATANADLTRRPEDGPEFALTLRASPYAPDSDARTLGVQVDRVALVPVRSDWLAGAFGGWRWAVRLVLFAAVAAVAARGRWRGLWGGGVALAASVALVAVPDSRLVLPPLLVPASVGLVGWASARHLWSERGTVAAWRERLAAFPQRSGANVFAALDRAAVFRVAVAALIAVYVAGVSLVIARVDFIGHADYADNAVRARNIVAGRGDAVDYVAQFYRTYPASIAHPAETWPPLQPWLIAAAFRVFGVSTAAAKLPNVAIMAGLLAFVAAVGSWRWGRRVGLLAAAFLAANVPFFAGTLVPLNDLAFALLFGGLAVAAYLAWGRREELNHKDTKTRRHAKNVFVYRLRVFVSLWFVFPALVGTVAGLLVLAKPSGAVLAAGAVGAALLIGRRNRRSVVSLARGAGIAVCAVGATYAPWAVRNLVTFGAPFASTETYDAWVLKYDPRQPTEGIYRVFAGGELPHPRVLVGYGVDHLFAVQWREVTRFAAGFADGSLVPGVVVALALVGMIVSVRRPRTAGFGAVLAGAFALYTPFVLLYWHYEARYFLVFVPWLCLYAAHGLLWGADALRSAVGSRRSAENAPDAPHMARGTRHLSAADLLALAVALTVIAPGVGSIAYEARQQTSGNEAVVIGRWLAENTPPDAVIMTRNPWEISWHSGRRAVMLPLGSAAEIYDTMRRYNVTVLQLDHLKDTTTIRWSVEDLYRYRERPGISRLHYDPDANGVSGYLIYRVEPDTLPKG